MKVLTKKEWYKPALGSASSPIILGMSYNLTREELLVKYVKLAQGSNAWLEWRRSGIGASEAASILGVNPWVARQDVLKEKTEPSKKPDDNVHTIRGKKLEPKAREIYEALMGYEMPPVCAMHDDYDFIRCSFDGIREDGKLIVEIKCPTQRWHEHVIHDGVPDWYFAQIQHQLLVANADTAHFVSYCPTFVEKPFVLKTVKRDEQFQKILLKELLLFWQEVENKNRG